MSEIVIGIEEVIKDDKNFNKGTESGRKMIDYSLQRFGAGRSIVLDKNNRVISGNHLIEAANNAGYKTVRVVEVTGDKLVAVKRTDVDLDSSMGREFALADNVTASVNLDIDYNKIKEVMDEVELHPEVWDVKIPNMEQNTVNVNSAGDNNTIICDSFKVSGYDIIMGQEESDALAERAKEYKEKNHSLYGFIRTLLDEYNERRSRENG